MPRRSVTTRTRKAAGRLVTWDQPGGLLPLAGLVSVALPAKTQILRFQDLGNPGRKKTACYRVRSSADPKELLRSISFETAQVCHSTVWFALFIALQHVSRCCAFVDKSPGEAVVPRLLRRQPPVPAASPVGGIFVWRWDFLIFMQHIHALFFDSQLVKPVFHTPSAYAQCLAHLFDGLACIVICKVFILLFCPIVPF